MKFKIIVACLLFPIWLPAQDCTKELLAQKPGKWKAGQQGSINNVSVADFAKEKLALAPFFLSQKLFCFL
ncbi:MAG TPA: hypothetical protein VIQ00_03900 [Chitinophagaceae bacterium]|jgi:hypothetical protein